MIRRSKLNISFSTSKKKKQLDNIIKEYIRVVNLYIQEYSTHEKIPKFVDLKVETWLSVRMQQCAGKQALENIRSLWKDNSNIRYKRYKKVYAYFKKHNRQLKFLDKRWKELNLRNRWLIKPEMKKEVLNLDSRFIDIKIDNKNSFDIWFKMTSIGNKIKLMLPSRKHKHFIKFSDWKMLKSTRLYKKDEKYYIDVLFEKEEVKNTGKEALGIDLGLNKLLSLSSGEQYGELKPLINKLYRRKQKSRRWNETLTEIKNYISQQINKLDLTNINTIVLENLKNISKSTKGRLNKTTRKLLSKWNRELVYDRLNNLCEVSGTKIAWINPKYTSQTCPSCNHVERGNRNGEYFKCKQCGYEANADVTAANNILNLFLREFIVPSSA